MGEQSARRASSRRKSSRPANSSGKERRQSHLASRSTVSKDRHQSRTSSRRPSSRRAGSASSTTSVSAHRKSSNRQPRKSTTRERRRSSRKPSSDPDKVRRKSRAASADAKKKRASSVRSQEPRRPSASRRNNSRRSTSKAGSDRKKSVSRSSRSQRASTSRGGDEKANLRRASRNSERARRASTARRSSKTAARRSSRRASRATSRSSKSNVGRASSVASKREKRKSKSDNARDRKTIEGRKSEQQLKRKASILRAAGAAPLTTASSRDLTKTDSMIRAAIDLNKFESSVAHSLSLMQSLGFKIEFTPATREQLQRLRSDALDLKRAYLRNETQRRSLEQENLELHKYIIDIEQKEASLQFKLKDFERQIAEKEEECEELAERVKRARDDGEQQIHAIEVGREEMETRFNHEVEKMEQQERVLMRQYRELDRERDHHMDVINESRTKLEIGEKELRSVCEQVESSKREAELLQSQLDRLRRERAELQKLWESKIYRAKQDVQMMRERYAEKTGAMDKYLRQLQSRIEESQYCLARQQQERDNVRKELKVQEAKACEFYNEQLGKMQSDLVDQFKKQATIARRLKECEVDKGRAANPACVYQKPADIKGCKPLNFVTPVSARNAQTAGCNY